MAPIQIIIFASLFFMLLSVLFNWQINIKNYKLKLYWVVIILCAILCIIFNEISINELKNIFFNFSSINPLKILIIFISLTCLSTLLNQIGFFEFLAKKVAQKFNSSQTKLFFAFSILIAVLTIFTSNDILILTFTPFICYFAKHAKINAIPYIVSEFVTANTWSMFFLIGNPTNIYIGSVFNIGFADYSKIMFLPTIVAGLTSMLVTYFLFRNSLKEPIRKTKEKIKKLDKIPTIIGISSLIITIILMVCSSWTGWDLWLIPLFMSIITILFLALYLKVRKKGFALIEDTLKNIPYELVPFLLGMSIIIETLNNVGMIDTFSSFMGDGNVFTVGAFSFLFGNIINNIPMTMFFSKILENISFVSIKMIYSVIISSNICAFLTPVGALAGIMFLNILRTNRIDFHVKDFIRYGAIISIPTLLVTLTTLYLV